MPAYTLAQTAKTWVAAIGAVATALLGILAGDATVGQILTAVAAVATAGATYGVPNAPTEDAAEVPEMEMEPH